ncbi:MAG: 1,4-beta-xylanase, partial [Pseudomonadota bacterium]
SEGSTVDLLEVFAQRQVGAINWGLVDGRTQTRFPWRSWQEQVADDEPWFHELLHADGTPYADWEAAHFRRFSGVAEHRE